MTILSFFFAADDKKYYKTKTGETCPLGEAIKTDVECDLAALELNIDFDVEDGIFNSVFWPSGCTWSWDNRGFFNAHFHWYSYSSTVPTGQEGGGICKKRSNINYYFSR